MKHYLPISVSLLFSLVNAFAQAPPPGTLDLNFIPVISTNATVQAMAALSGGQVLVGGSTHEPGGLVVFPLLLRLNKDGSVDNTFQAYNAEMQDGSISSIVALTDGRVLVTGQLDNHEDRTSHLARINPDGSLDASFAPRLNLLSNWEPRGPFGDSTRRPVDRAHADCRPFWT